MGQLVKNVSVDKVIIANRSGMIAKYGSPGVAAIYAALARLVAADGKKGCFTIVINVDDQAQLASYGARAIANGRDEKGTKDAVDAIDTKLTPDYFMLLDGPDIIPHITLNKIPGLTDSDQDIPSDLPYACAGPYSRNASSYLAITRVVGRLPMAEGASNAEDLVNLIERCAAHLPQPSEAFKNYFAISAHPWTASTQLSLSAVFGGFAALNISPAATHTAIDPSLSARAHFINCHGARADPRFYGQLAAQFPMAMDSAQIAPHIQLGTVAAVECCYGAELYNSKLLGTTPICMSYLLNGAVAYLGSTNIAYGPAASNGQADLICQFFLSNSLGGASIGRAMLQARQQFVSSQTMSFPTNLKTLAQFNLYGDPSLVAVDVSKEVPAVDTIAKEIVASSPEIGKSHEDGRRLARKARRVSLRSGGVAIAATATRLSRKIKEQTSVRIRFNELAKSRGYLGAPEMFKVSGGRAFVRASKALDVEHKIAIVCEESIWNRVESAEILPAFRVLVAHILDDRIISIHESESR